MPIKTRLLPDEHQTIAFGIPSLDRLIGVPEGASASDREKIGYSLHRDGEEESATFCIIGPDGTGKSIFAMHMASDYWRRTSVCSDQPRIIYASSDLSTSRAIKVWQSFWLDRPNARWNRVPFEEDWSRPTDPVNAELQALDDEEWPFPRDGKAPGPRNLQLKPYSPNDDDFSHYLISGATGGQPQHIAFLDLESTTSGDDWGFLHASLAVLPTPEKGQPRHLLVIDAVEGLETLVGERDSFGQLQSRRSRIAQIVRAASDKCHLVFVIEEPKDGERLPEVFVSDMVVRLRSTTDRDYARRTVELEKVRGQRHIRGQHDFRIRQEGSKTGDQFNPDDPAVGSKGAEEKASPAGARMAYVQVFPSLHYLTRDVPVEDTDHATAWGAHDWRFSAFGIYQLDSMLWRPMEPEYGIADRAVDGDDLQLIQKHLPNDSAQQELIRRELGKLDRRTLARDVAGFDWMGVPAGTITTLIGNDSTYKSLMARAFLAQAFRTRHVFRHGASYLRVVDANAKDALLGQGVALLLTTSDLDKARVMEKLRSHLIKSPMVILKEGSTLGPEEQVKGIAERLFVRALAPHHMPSALFIHAVRELVAEGKRFLYRRLAAEGQLPSDRRELRRLNGRIRLVIDDWSTLMSMYPEVQRDPLVLKYLTTYLTREGVTVLIVANRSGNPNDRDAGELEEDIRELRSVAQQHLFTWHVSFFDEQRVAITAQPSAMHGTASVVRELRPARAGEVPRDLWSADERRTPLTERAQENTNEAFDAEALWVDPHFEIYSGLQDGKPTPVPLEVRLYAERDDIPAFQGYLSELAELFRHMFGHDGARSVLRPQYGPQYDILRELSYLRSEARLDHTIVLQVDEFWAESRSELLRQERYLSARTVDRDDRLRDQDNNLKSNDRGPSRRAIKTEDPFGLFYLSDSMDRRTHAEGRGRSALHRRDFFDLVGYDLVEASKKYPIDKVPYSWDFGFLLCDWVVWDKCKLITDHRTRGFGPNKRSQSVGDIWDRLWRIDLTHREEELERIDNVNDLDDRPRAMWKTQMPEEKKLENGEQIWLYSFENHLGEPVPQQGGGWDHTGQVHQDPVTWREFLGACVTIAKQSRDEHSAFDVDLLATESFSCLFLEVWFSEAWMAMQQAGVDDDERLPMKYRHDDRSLSLKRLLGKMYDGRAVQRDLEAIDNDIVRVVCQHYEEENDKPPSLTAWIKLIQVEVDRRVATGAGKDDITRKLRDLVAKIRKSFQDTSAVYRRALYRTMLLLDQVFGRFDQPSEDNFHLQPRRANTKAVACRHWYSTATIAMKPEESRRLLVVGLPGNFSCRGDWFLAVAKGSRSARLGERAIDILSSRRANISRLQNGLGLPVRDLFGPSDDPSWRQARPEYRTSLSHVDGNGRSQKIMYRELRKLGAFDARDGLGRKDNFHWIWRSGINEYDIHSRVWMKWVTLLFKEWRSWAVPYAPAEKPVVAPQPQNEPWLDGFLEYDYYCGRDQDDSEVIGPCFVPEDNPRWARLNLAIDSLIDTLDRTGNPPDRRSSGSVS